MSAHTTRSATRGVLSVVILAFAMAAIAVPDAAASSPLDAAHNAKSAAEAATNAPPYVQAEGHLHTVVPQVVVSTAHGVGVRRGALPGKGHLDVLLAGRGGLPRTGIRAVALNISATGTRSPTLYVGSSKTRPGVPVVRSGTSTASNFAIAALDARGHLGLWGGSAPEQVTIEVTGWFASGSRPAQRDCSTRWPGGRFAPSSSLPANPSDPGGRSSRRAGVGCVRGASPIQDERSECVRDAAGRFERQSLGQVLLYHKARSRHRAGTAAPRLARPAQQGPKARHGRYGRARLVHQPGHRRHRRCPARRRWFPRPARHTSRRPAARRR